ncbi:MAG: hypothetical protein AB7I30_03335 [Isosphaeraceae bacterium]
MHSIVIVTALTAASGIFGGGRAASCPNGQCPSAIVAPTPASAPAPVTWGYQAPTPTYPPRYVPTVSYPAPRMVPHAIAPRFAAPQYYLPSTVCATGTCPGR